MHTSARGPSGARPAPPLPKDPLKANARENNHTQTYTKIYTDIHIHIHTDTHEQIHTGSTRHFFSHLFRIFLEVSRQAPKKPPKLFENAYKLIPEWLKMVRNLVQKSETIDTCWAERSEVRPPLTQGPPEAHSLENSYTNKHADMHKDTHTNTRT